MVRFQSTSRQLGVSNAPFPFKTLFCFQYMSLASNKLTPSSLETFELAVSNAKLTLRSRREAHWNSRAWRLKRQADDKLTLYVDWKRTFKPHEQTFETTN